MPGLRGRRDADSIRAAMQLLRYLRQGHRLGDCLASMLVEMESVHAQQTVEWTRHQWRGISRFLPPRTWIDSVAPADLQRLIRESIAAGLGAQTIANYRCALSRLFRWAVRTGRTTRNPVDLVEWPRVPDSMPDVFTAEELTALLAEIPRGDQRDIMVLMAHTGLRRSETARVHADHFDMRQEVLWVHGKTRRQSIPLAPAVLPVVHRAVARGGWLVDRPTEYQRARRIDHMFRRWSRELGDRRLHPHALRHSLATILIRRGVSPATVQQVLRHRSYATTQRYVHLIADDVRQATARLGLA